MRSSVLPPGPSARPGPPPLELTLHQDGKLDVALKLGPAVFAHSATLPPPQQLVQQVARLAIECSPLQNHRESAKGAVLASSIGLACLLDQSEGARRLPEDPRKPSSQL